MVLIFEQSEKTRFIFEQGEKTRFLSETKGSY